MSDLELPQRHSQYRVCATVLTFGGMPVTCDNAGVVMPGGLVDPHLVMVMVMVVVMERVGGDDYGDGGTAERALDPTISVTAAGRCALRSPPWMCPIQPPCR